MNKKAYEITTFIIDDILEVVVTGDISMPEMHDIMIKEVIAMEKTMNVRKQLIDLRTLEGRLGITKIYDLVRDYPTGRPRMKTAIIDTVQNDDTSSFHETTAYNAGLRLKFFTDINEARTWLKGK